MSEHEEPRPLTRREIRLRDMAEAERKQQAAAPPAQPPSDDDDIEISPFNEDGTPRTRREIRELRERALAERAADRSEAESDEPAVVEAPVAVEEPAEGEDPAAAAEEIPEAEEPEHHEEPAAAETEEAEEVTKPAEADVESAESESIDAAYDAPTQPFTVADLQEAEQKTTDDEDAEDDPELAPDEAPAARSGLRLPWRRGNKSKEAEPVAESPSASTDTPEAPRDDAEEDSLPESLEETDDRPLDVTEEAAAVEEIVPSSDSPDSDHADDTDSTAEKSGYSFPNIEPPEEWRSVFDDPSTRVVPSASPSSPEESDEPVTGSAPGFDDLISRAVSQEGSTGGTGASALILPSMPNDSGLAGPLGGTGELFVTGSIEVPKSIGETGGHSALHDSVEVDPMDDLGGNPPVLGDRDSGPVSARSAVSAMAMTGVPPVNEVKKDRSKLPLILSLTGGGLVVVVGGLVVWGAMNGLFG